MNDRSDTEHSALAPDSTDELAARTVVRAPAPPPSLELERVAVPTLAAIYDLLWQNRQDEQANRRANLALYGQVQKTIEGIQGEIRSIRGDTAGIHSRLAEGDSRFGQIETAHIEALDRVTAVLGKLQLRDSEDSDDLLNTTVLIVEDDPAVRKLVVQVCRAAGAFTIPVSNTVQAREELARLRPPAACTIDILLGAGGDGMALARDIATHRQDVGVVILTGGLTVHQKREAEALGIRCLGKPFDTDTLVAALAAARNAARQ